ncbi:hypothetical protein ACIGB6_07475 [Paeniglutamicibacter gangotriensis]|uniref:hypothetical protein n=1 Tax=Paeniglutamicibacter gangotriensis TaxID=254787 RepID=UPI0037C9BA7E
MGIKLRSNAGAPVVPGPSPAWAATMRVVGATAIVLAASMVIQNAMFVATGAPGFGDPIEEVLAWHQQNRVTVAIAVGQEALHLPLLIGFVTGLHGLVGRRGGAGADWSCLTVAAGATLSAVLALYAVLWIGVVQSADGLAEPGPTFELAWQLHAAAYALTLPALGTTLIGAALAAHTSRLTPPWQRLLGVAGGILLLAAGLANFAIADGSALLFVGLPGLAAWFVWLLATGIRLVRTRTADRPGNASTYDDRAQENDSTRTHVDPDLPPLRPTDRSSRKKNR